MGSGPPTTTMYCRQCGYALVGLSENRCPECGRGFEPANPRTYCRSTRTWWIRRWVRRLGVVAVGVFMGVALVVGVTLGVVYWQWRAEQSIIASLRHHLCIVTVAPLNRPWQQQVFDALQRDGLPWQEAGNMASKFSHLTERAVSIEYRGTVIRRGDLAQIARLPELRSVSFVRMGLEDDADFADIARLRHLTSLTLIAVPVSDASLERLEELPPCPGRATIGRAGGSNE